MNTTKHCVGCRDNYYNQPGNSTTGQCWYLSGAKLVTRFKIYRDTPSNQKRGYIKVQVPDCYRAPGWFYVEKIPSYAE